MKLKKFFKNKVAVAAIGGVLLLALVGGGVYLAQKKSNDFVKGTDKNSNSTGSSSQQSAKNQNTQGTTKNTGNQSTANQVTTNQNALTTDNLSDVSIQGLVDKSSGDISINLYGGPGKYTIDKQVNGSWVNIGTDLSYAGSGGLAANDTIPMSELSRLYRIYRTVNGVKSQAKEVTVDRNLINSNGGSASFQTVEAQ